MALTKINSSVIANNTIAVGNIADNSVDATKIASNSILTRHIDDNQIGIDQLSVSDGSNGQMLTTNGSGTLSFTTPSSFDADGAQVFNESGAAVDFRIEGDTEQNLFFVDGTADKIGVATSSPAETLDVSGNALLSGSDGTLRKLTFGATGGNHGSIGVDASGHTFVDVETSGGVLHGKIGGNERLKLQDSGPVMTITEAGTDGYETLLKLYRSSSSANEVGMQFDLSGSGGAGQAVGIYAAKTEDWSSGTSRSATLNFQVKDDGTDQVMYQFGNFSDGVNQHKFYTEGAERMRILQGGGITFNGDTAAANALDDYETGSWTPDCSTSAGDSSIGVTVNYAKYIKIGDLVFVSCYLSLSVNTAGSGAGRITGLPFAVGTNSGYHIGALAHANAVVAQGTNGVAFYAQQGQSYVRFVNVTDTGNVGFVQGGTKYLMMSVVYTTQSY